MSEARIDAAMVLAAGLGLRMRPLTDERPKPLVELAGRTLLDRALDRLSAAAVSRIVVNSHYKGEMIAAHLDGRPDIVLTPEEVLLETGGGVKAALPHLGDGPFYVVNSDAVWRDGPTPTLERLAAHWNDGAMDALLLLVPTPTIIGATVNDRGDYYLEPDGRARRRVEGEIAPFLFGGVQILHPRLFEAAPEGPFSLNLLYDQAQGAGRLYGMRHDGEWYHVGTPGDLVAAESELGNGRSAERPPRW
ncbi:MAG: nucleotidyltransferase family protein [Rhodospirillales bacterium]|nr:MAG: nucleotidyltransferase family protein [Rhodospirillales bacterium]